MRSATARPSDSLRGSEGRAGEDQTAAGAQPAGGMRFDWAVAGLSVWFLGGLFLDGWAHNHNRVDDSFFTPWHAVFYSGFFAVAAGLLAATIRNRAGGLPWRQAVPAGYELSLLGAALFAAGGVADMIWHTVLGIEVGVEALLSPTHLLLATGMTLIFSGPLRAAWRRAGPPLTWASALPMLLSLTFVLSLFTFMTQFMHPMVYPDMTGERPARYLLAYYSQALGVANIVVQTGLLLGLLLFVLRRWHWRLPFGSLTLILTLNAFALSFMQDDYWSIPVAFVGGAAADLLLHRLKPSDANPGALRWFAMAVPLVLYLIYFLTLIVTRGIWWSVHMWAGAIVLAGVTGLLVSYLLVPPARPAGVEG